MHALSVVMPAALADDVSDALADALDALSVTIEDADAGTADESPVFDEPGAGEGAWRRARLTALFADEAAARAAAAVVANIDCGVESTRVDVVDAHDWVRLSQSLFDAVEVAPGFWIVPSWADVPGDARDVVRLDPGLAFGTGTHPTTRMCLAWLAARRDTAWPRVLDYGCGSGVLSIAAKTLGALQVDAVDIDPAAIETTARNAAANNCKVHAGPVGSARGRYALVVANILATPLKLLAPVLAGHLAPGGELLLAGILERQAGKVGQAYASHLALGVVAADDGWVALAGKMARPISDR